MKGLKRFAMLVLSLALVLGLVCTASAATASFSVRKGGHGIHGSLNLGASTVSASMSVTVEGGGPVTAAPACSLIGGAVDKSGIILAGLSKSGVDACSDSSSFDGTADHAECTYSFMGEPVKENLTTK